MVRTSLSEIITSSSNLQTNMLLLLVGHLGYPEVRSLAPVVAVVVVVVGCGCDELGGGG
jgi:hypothetical protein